MSLTNNIVLPLILGLIFGILAAASAYLITYQEYVNHFPDKSKPRRMAIKTASVVFLFFVLSIIAIWFIFIYIFHQGGGVGI